MEYSRQKRAIKILYITAGIFFLIGFYMYTFGIVATKGPITAGGARGTLPDSFTGKGVIGGAFIFALYGAFLHYQLRKNQSPK